MDLQQFSFDSLVGPRHRELFYERDRPRHFVACDQQLSMLVYVVLGGMVTGERDAGQRYGARSSTSPPASCDRNGYRRWSYRDGGHGLVCGYTCGAGSLASDHRLRPDLNVACRGNVAAAKRGRGFSTQVWPSSKKAGTRHSRLRPFVTGRASHRGRAVPRRIRARDDRRSERSEQSVRRFSLHRSRRSFFARATAPASPAHPSTTTCSFAS